jgi:hypothetical protein
MRIGIGVALAVVLWTPVACKKKSGDAARRAVEAKRIATTVQMGDPRAAGQLISGFYDIESNAWRWTGKQFVIELGTPLGAAGRGATLELQFTVPPVVLEKNPSVTISATVDGNVLAPETVTSPGEHVYKRDVPAELLGGDSVKATFAVDKTLEPGVDDRRVLGVIATSASLIRK